MHSYVNTCTYIFVYMYVIYIWVGFFQFSKIKQEKMFSIQYIENYTKYFETHKTLGLVHFTTLEPFH